MSARPERCRALRADRGVGLRSIRKQAQPSCISTSRPPTSRRRAERDVRLIAPSRHLRPRRRQARPGWRHRADHQRRLSLRDAERARSTCSRAGGRRAADRGLRARPARSRPTASRSRTAGDAAALRGPRQGHPAAGGRAASPRGDRGAARGGVLVTWRLPQRRSLRRGARLALAAAAAASRCRPCRPLAPPAQGLAARQQACRSRSPPTSLEVVQDQQVATFTGNVDAVQGELVLSADQLRVLLLRRRRASAGVDRRLDPAHRGRGQRLHVVAARRPRRASSASTTSPARC